MASEKPGLLDDYWTISEMAAQARVSERTLARWNSLRIGPPRTVIGRQTFYHIPAAKAWLLAQQEEVALRKRGAA